MTKGTKHVLGLVSRSDRFGHSSRTEVSVMIRLEKWTEVIKRDFDLSWNFVL